VHRHIERGNNDLGEALEVLDDIKVEKDNVGDLGGITVHENDNFQLGIAAEKLVEEAAKPRYGEEGVTTDLSVTTNLQTPTPPPLTIARFFLRVEKVLVLTTVSNPMFSPLSFSQSHITFMTFTTMLLPHHPPFPRLLRQECVT